MEYNIETYDLMLEELFSLHPSVQNKGFETGAYKPGLKAMEDFNNSLGDPCSKYKIIHVAGTNGKGSVCSMIAAGIAANGYKVGLYTSPHLVDFRERIKIIQGSYYELISKDFVLDFINKNNLQELSFFEITTGLAFSYFEKQKVDYAVIETGLGGRLDSTNIIKPCLSVITSIGLDHCALLGNTLEEIAREKAGIIKEGTPVLIEDNHNDDVFIEVAKNKTSPIYFIGEETHKYEGFDLKGPYQNRNISTAIKAIELLGLNPKIEALSRAAKISGFRGRWEIIQEKNPTIICDIGHNPAALEINFSRLIEMNRPLFIVYGVMADKDYKSVRKLMPQSAKYFAVSPKNERALSIEKLSEVLDGLNFIIAESVYEGAQLAIKAAQRVPNSLVYIGGSNFVVAEFLED